MRACTSSHLFAETSPEHYTHNAFSKIFLSPSNRDMFRQMYDFTGQGVYQLPQFLASSGWQNPGDYDRSAFQYAHRTDLGLWEYLKQEPERTKVFNSGMRSIATIGGSSKGAGAYPLADVLSKEPVKDTDVVIVDVGGGRGQALEAIKSSYPDLGGRMVLQDVQDVIDDARSGGLPEFIESQVASFFDKQPVKGK
jgi:O-methyltransferase domain